MVPAWRGRRWETLNNVEPGELPRLAAPMPSSGPQGDATQARLACTEAPLAPQRAVMLQGS